MELGCSSLFILERIFIARRKEKKEAQQKRGPSYFKPVTFGFLQSVKCRHGTREFQQPIRLCV